MAEQQVSNDHVLGNTRFIRMTDPTSAHHDGRCALHLLAASLRAKANTGGSMDCDELHGAAHIIEKALETWAKGWDEVERTSHQA